jgi:hypothetical protein
LTSLKGEITDAHFKPIFVEGFGHYKKMFGTAYLG